MNFHSGLGSPTKSFTYFIRLTDVVLLSGSYYLAYRTVPLVRSAFIREDISFHFDVTILTGLLIPLVWLFVLDLSGMYRDLTRISYWKIARSLLQMTLLGLGFLTLMLFALKEADLSRLLLFIFGIYSFLCLLVSRVFQRWYFVNRHRAGYYSKKIVVIGTSDDVCQLQGVFSDHDTLREYSVVGYINTDPALNGTVAGAPELGSIENLKRELARQEVSEVLLVWDARGTPELDCILQTCLEFGKRVRLIPRFSLDLNPTTLPDMSVHAETFWGLPSITLSILRYKPEQVFIKRLMDIVISFVLLIVLSPLFLAVAIAIKLTSPGPVLYRWCVLGRNNREFVGYKFRTMVVNADEIKAALMPLNEMQGAVFKMKNDPRVTPLGKWLRKYSLDELPQLWSVLKGDMSLVGPRPVFRSEFERFQFWQMRKLSVRPGITCLWQVNGRNEINDMNDWIRLDLKYIDDWTLGLDLKILAKTALVVLKGTGH